MISTIFLTQCEREVISPSETPIQILEIDYEINKSHNPLNVADYLASTRGAGMGMGGGTEHAVYSVQLLPGIISFNGQWTVNVMNIFSLL